MAPIHERLLPGQRDGNDEGHIGDPAEADDPPGAVQRRNGLERAQFLSLADEIEERADGEGLAQQADIRGIAGKHMAGRAVPQGDIAQRADIEGRVEALQPTHDGHDGAVKPPSGRRSRRLKASDQTLATREKNGRET